MGRKRTNQPYPTGIEANLRFRAKVLESAQGNEERQESLMDMCADGEDGLIFWLGTFVYTFRQQTSNPQTRPADEPSQWPLIPWEYQLESFKGINSAIDEGHDLLIEKSRDMGASWMVLMVFLWRFLFREGETFMVASDKKAKVDERGNQDTLFSKLRYVIDRLPSWMCPELTGSDDRVMHLANPWTECVIDGASTTEDLAAGGRRTALMMDEHARWEEGYEALNATADVTPTRFFVSTAKGRGNAFWLVRDSGKVPIMRLYWIDHPEKSKGLYEVVDGAVRLLDDFKGWVRLYEDREWHWYEFPENYPFVTDGPHTEWRYHSPWFDSECNRRASRKEIAQDIEIHYEKSGDSFFEADMLDRLLIGAGPPLERFKLDYTYDPVEEEVWFEKLRTAVDGPLRVWRRLRSDMKLPQDDNYVIGADVSMGSGASNSVAKIASVGEERIVAEYADPNTSPDKFAMILFVLTQWVGGHCGKPYVIWEAQGPGINIGKRFRDFGYTYVYHNRDELTDRPTEQGRAGWFPNPNKKEWLLGELRSALAGSTFSTPCTQTIEEARRYIRDDAGRIICETGEDITTGARKAHGDRVIATALCNLGMELQPKVTIPGGHDLPPPNSFEGRRRRAQMRTKTDSYWQ